MASGDGGAQYGEDTYWNDRYTECKAPFEWYQPYATLEPIIKRHISSEALVLNVGCGNSRLSADMHTNGIVNITNIDISQTVIDAMKEEFSAKAEMEWTVMDARTMSLGDDHFDAVIDKGTLDSVLCSKEAVDHAHVYKMVEQVYRVLKPGGVYIMISYASPKYRLAYLDLPDLLWKLNPVQRIPKLGVLEETDASDSHYVYVLTKQKAEATAAPQPRPPPAAAPVVEEAPAAPAAAADAAPPAPAAEEAALAEVEVKIPSVEVEVKLPSVKVEVKAPSVEVEVKLPSVEVEVKAPSVEVKVKLPSISFGM